MLSTPQSTAGQLIGHFLPGTWVLMCCLRQRSQNVPLHLLQGLVADNLGSTHMPQTGKLKASVTAAMRELTVGADCSTEPAFEDSG